MARIDRTEIRNYIEFGELWQIPIVCTGDDQIRHTPQFIDAEPDARSVYCTKCGKWQPIGEIRI